MNIFNDFEVVAIDFDSMLWEGSGSSDSIVISTAAEMTIACYNPTYQSGMALVPCAQIDISGYAPQIITTMVLIPLSAISLTGYNPSITYVLVLKITDTGSLNVAVYPPAFGPSSTNIPAAAVLKITPYQLLQIWDLPLAEKIRSQSIFQCILTGDADGRSDLIIPISSFQSTIRDGNPSYLACVIPNSMAYIDDIICRTNGDIVIRQGFRLSNGIIQTKEIIRVDYENYRIDRGANNDSAEISGHKTISSDGEATDEDVSYAIVKSTQTVSHAGLEVRFDEETDSIVNIKWVTLSDVSYYGIETDGKRTIRCKPDINLSIGDIAVYGDIGFAIGQISYTVSTTQQIMQITEKEEKSEDEEENEEEGDGEGEG